jgi:1,4-alpha-glucan branching enzyme
MLAVPSVIDRALQNVSFRLNSREVPHATSVVLVGSFNRWDSAVHRLALDPGGWWTITLTLGPGEYPYLFLVDGIPWNDPEDDGRTPCEWGGHYSVRVVR